MEQPEHDRLHNRFYGVLPDGQKVDIGGEVTYIIGTDQCSTGFGSTYACWRFSLKSGDTQLVSLANGTQELWTTEDAGSSGVSLVRPNGFKVVDYEYPIFAMRF